MTYRYGDGGKIEIDGDIGVKFRKCSCFELM
jgi:hypothetical protein